MDLESRRDLTVLEAISENQQITQRSLSSRLGMALGLTNLYLKRLVRKGYIKCVSVRPNRLRYLLTPKGIAEKSRLTYEFLEYSLRLYRQVREHMRDSLRQVAAGSGTRVALYGTGEAAELAYLSLKEMNFEPVAILDGENARHFLGLPVLDVHHHPLTDYDLIVTATLENPEAMIAQLEQRGVPRERIVTLRRDVGRKKAGNRSS
jgi:DNA-binding MarR family transcriptional regulator